MKLKALSQIIKCFTVYFKVLLNTPAFKEFEHIFFIARFTWFVKFIVCVTNCVKNIVVTVGCKDQRMAQKSLIKILARTKLNLHLNITTMFSVGRRCRWASSSFRMGTGFPLHPEHCFLHVCFLLTTHRRITESYYCFIWWCFEFCQWIFFIF